MTSKIVTEPTAAEIKARYLAWNESGNPDDFCFPRIACGILLDMLDKYEEEINKYHQAGVDLLREKRAAEKVIKDWGLENADSEEAQSWRQRAMGAEATVEKLRQKVSGWREWADLSDTPESKDASECVKICADELEQLLEDVK